VFYTCGASSFVASAIFAPLTALCSSDTTCADNNTRLFTGVVATGVSLPTGSVITSVSVTLDWQAFGGTNPQAPATTNCFPQEKSFTLRSPSGTIITLFPGGAASFAATQTSCPRSVLLFTDTGATAITVASTITATGTYRPQAGTFASLN
jgi:hypothetical protein